MGKLFHPNLIVPQPGSRSIVLGQTGTGKTYLGRRIVNWLKPGRRFLLIDPKHEIDWFPDAKLIGSYNDTRKTDVLLYRPTLRTNVATDVDILLEQVFDQGDWEIYCDELFALYKNNRYPELLQDILTMGRTRGIGFTGLSQRPRGIPIHCMAQAQQFYCFALPHADDRDVVKGLIGDKGKQIPPRYSFHFHSYELSPDELPDRPLKIVDNLAV